MPRATTRVYISDTLVIRALNTPGGSGGVAADMNKTALSCKRSAIAYAPVNNPLSATHRGGVVGTYRRSFKTAKRGNQHVLARFIYNDAPHAVFVEKGRSSTRFTLPQDFWTKTTTHWENRVGNGLRNYDPTKRYTYWKQDPVLAGSGRWELFGWAKNGGNIWWYAGTSARKGQHVLERALHHATAKYTAGVKLGKAYKTRVPRPRLGPGGYVG